MTIPEFNTSNTSSPRILNRGLDTAAPDSVAESHSVGLYTIDNAILRYLQAKIRPVVDQSGKAIPVPVIYGNPERWKSAQVDGFVRDKNGKILLPIIMVRRSSMERASIDSPVNKYQQYTFKTQWNARNAYDRFAIVNGITPSELYHVATVPDHYNITYEMVLWTEYNEQMNSLVENISFESNEYWGEDNNYRFIATIDRFDHTTELPANEDRMVQSRCAIAVRAYILPETQLDVNGNRTQTTKLRYSPKKLVFSSEVVRRLP
jgi:hypothetical protein